MITGIIEKYPDSTTAKQLKTGRYNVNTKNLFKKLLDDEYKKRHEIIREMEGLSDPISDLNANVNIDLNADSKKKRRRGFFR